MMLHNEGGGFMAMVKPYAQEGNEMTKCTKREVVEW